MPRVFQRGDARGAAAKQENRTAVASAAVALAAGVLPKPRAGRPADDIMPRYRKGRRCLPALSDQRVLCKRHACAKARFPNVVSRKLPPNPRPARGVRAPLVRRARRVSGARRPRPRATISAVTTAAKRETFDAVPDGLLALGANSHRGHRRPAHTLHQAIAYSKPLNATGLPVPLYDFRSGPRCTGKLRDYESGLQLDFFGARYFGSAMGRFTSADPKMFPSAFGDPQSWNKYAYTRNNPLRYVDPNGEDWMDVVAGAMNASGSDFLFGAGRATGGNADFRVGQAVGDAVATVAGTAVALFGGTETVVTSPAAVTVVGAVIPAAGVAAAAYGTSAAVVAGGHLVAAAFASDATSSGRPYEGTPQNQDRMSKGKAPVGKDGKPVELHHEGQASEGSLEELTQGEHRGGENFKKNHPNTGQQPSQIDRSKFRQQREQYWKDKTRKPDEQ